MAPPTYIDVAIFALLAVAFTGFVMAISRVRKTKAELDSSERLRNELAQGEKRMLDFLHHLGLSIDKENTPQKLHRVIVEGVTKVSKSKGAALYLIDKSEQHLRPAFISDDCAQLIPDPSGQTEDSERRAIRVRHTSINRFDGVLGHCLINNAPFLVDSLKGHPAFQDALVQYSADGAAMVAPLIHAGKQIGVLAVTKDSENKAYSLDDLYTFSSVTEQAAFAIGNFDAHHQVAEKKRIESELQTAQEVQRVLIPESAPDIPNFRLYGYNVPASMISGDYFDYTSVSESETGIVIADVSGKGVPAGIIMATFRSSLKAIATGSSSPAESLSQLNRLIYPDIREDMFISAVYCHLNHEQSTVSLARAGHNPPYLFDAQVGSLIKLKPPGLAVGIDTGDVFSRILKDHEIKMHSGDSLILYTDGIIEANNKDGDEYTAARFEQALVEHHTEAADELGKSILADIDQFVGDAPQSDDITLVIIEKL